MPSPWIFIQSKKTIVSKSPAWAGWRIRILNNEEFNLINRHMSFIMESWTVTFRGTKHSSTVQNLNPGQSVWSSNGTCISTFNNLKKSMRHRATKLNKVNFVTIYSMKSAPSLTTTSGKGDSVHASTRSYFSGHRTDSMVLSDGNCTVFAST